MDPNGTRRLRGGLAKAGYDWICVDLEHGAIGLETMTEILSCHIQKHTVSVVGIPVNHSKWISPASFPTLKP